MMKKIAHPEKGNKTGTKVSTTIFGTYPIGKFNTWHGGTHLEGTSELVAIADGKIIAYQITDNYETVAFEGKDQVYSKCFVLIQHDYEIKNGEDDKKEGKPIRFYSFYQHLMPLSEIKKPREFPDFLCDKKAVVKTKEQIKGAKMYEFIKGKKTKKTFIPNGTTVILNTGDRVTKGKYTYTLITSVDGVSLTNKCYISQSFINTNPIKKNSYVRTEQYTDPNNDAKGARVREKDNSNSKIVKLIPYGEVVAIDVSTKDKSWVKLADNSGYVFKSSLAYKNVFNEEECIKDKVKGCYTPVKAGQTIGYAGKNGTLGYENYANCHFEIFTDASDSDVKYFINNEAKNNFKTPRFFEVENGAKLKANITKTLDVRAKTPIKVLTVKDNSIKVEIIETIPTTVAYSNLIDNNDNSYSLKAATFDAVNTSFNDVLKVTDKLDYIERCDENGAKISKSENNKRKKEKLTEYRNVKFKPKHIKQTFWVKTTDIDVSTAQEEGLIINALTQVYINELKDETEDLTINEEQLIENKGLKNYTNKSTKEKWYYITCSYVENNNLVTKKGWISEKNSKFKAKNPHNWKEFGFEIIDAGEDYVYEVEGYNKAENSGDFINRMWELIDTDKNKRINRQEVINAFSDSKKLNKLAKFICKHKSEWAYTVDKIKEEAEQFYKIGIKEATGDKKTKLTEKKDKLIEVLASKLENLMCWKDIQKSTYTPPLISEEEKTKKKERLSMLPDYMQEEIKSAEKKKDNTNVQQISSYKKHKIDMQNDSLEQALQVKEKKVTKETQKRVLPKGDVFHYFHPISFLQHLEKIVAPIYNPDHGDFHDPIVNPQVRGWYNKWSKNNKDSEISGWNPYASMKMHKHANQIENEKVKEYGDPQRGGRGHQGLDIYAPVGTPIYACVDGKLTMHEITKRSAGFKIKLEGKYKEKHVRFNYIHLMQFKKTKFRFYNQNSSGKLGEDEGWLNYSDFTAQKQFTDPKKKETYTIHYDSGILKIDQNEIDVELALDIKSEYDLNIKTLKVKKGQIIGYTGSTGNSYQGKKANHLHFNTYINWKSVLPYEEFKKYFGLDISGTETSSKQDGVTPSGKW